MFEWISEDICSVKITIAIISIASSSYYVPFLNDVPSTYPNQKSLTAP